MGLGILLPTAFLLTMAALAGEGEQGVQVVAAVAAQEGEGFYTANRAPLAPSRLIKLPIGAITPKGWLRHQLELERDGITGNMPEVSRSCQFDGNAWGDPQGRGHNGTENLPYWLKGYGDLGYVLKDKAIMRQARRWIEVMFASQEPDGWFGPRALKTGERGHADFWPLMPALNVLQSYYESSGDARVLKCMTRYFRWQLNYPEANFMVGQWDAFPQERQP